MITGLSQLDPNGTYTYAEIVVPKEEFVHVCVLEGETRELVDIGETGDIRSQIFLN